MIAITIDVTLIPLKGNGTLASVFVKHIELCMSQQLIGLL